MSNNSTIYHIKNLSVKCWLFIYIGFFLKFSRIEGDIFDLRDLLLLIHRKVRHIMFYRFLLLSLDLLHLLTSDLLLISSRAFWCSAESCSNFSLWMLSTSSLLGAMANLLNFFLSQRSCQNILAQVQGQHHESTQDQFGMPVRSVWDVIRSDQFGMPVRSVSPGGRRGSDEHSPGRDPSGQAHTCLF